MSSDIQVVEVGEANSLVPNLTISVDNAEGEKDLPEIEYNNDISEEMPLSSETTQVKRRLDLFPRKKLYENNLVNSAASLGLSFEEAETRRKKRAARFQSPLISCEKKSVETPEELLAKSQISFNNMSKFNKNRSLDDDEFIRLEALHVQGVDSMNTSDIFAYFGRTNPHHIEWIDDHSCNVVWNKSEDARICMEMIAFPHEIASAPSVELSASFDDDLDLGNDTESKMEIENSQPENVIPVNPLRKCREAFEKNQVKNSLHFRFATIKDRKEKFAAKKSKYYVEHGNPHYGGAKGLLTSSYRRRYQKKKAMKEFRSLNPDNDDAKRSRVEQPDEQKRREDETLISSTVKDLNSDSSSDDCDVTNFGTMMADRVSQRVKAFRDMSERVNTSNDHSTSDTRIQSRLGTIHNSSTSARASSRVLDRVGKGLRQGNSGRSRRHKRQLQRYSPPSE